MPKKPRANPWYGSIPDGMGGYPRIVVAESEEKAKAALLAEYRKYARDHGSDYKDRIHAFDDLAECLGAFVRCVPWNVAVLE